MTLPEYIADLGDEAAAQLFDVRVRTVQSWRRRERYPRPEQAERIVRLSNGKVNYEGVYAPSEAA